jgi:hypothetical protein
MDTNSKDVTSCEALRGFVDELHRDYEVWYSKSTRRVMRTYSALQGLSLLSGFLTSVLTALTTKEMFGTNWRIVLIVLPSIGSLAATALLQFRVYDLWQLREDARIAFQDLVIEGRKRLAAAKNKQECYEIHESLQLRATAIEKENKDRFFALTRSTFVASFKAGGPSVP